MNTYFVRFTNDSVLKKVAQHGEITYQSPIMNLIGIRTETPKEELFNIQGVLKVEKERTGRIPFVHWD